MEGDVDAFLEEVRSSEKLLQELQERLRCALSENEQVQAQVAALEKEQHILAEESISCEQELAAVSSKTLLQDVRLKKVLEYKTQVKRDLEDADAELSRVRGQLQSEINELCSEAAQHLGNFGLNGVYRAEAKQQKLGELVKLRSQAEQLSERIKDLQQHEDVLKEELRKLADIEKDVESKRQKLLEPLKGRSRVHDLQQSLCRMGQEQRDGRHLQQLKIDISDAEDETICLRSAASAMSAELQRLEQLLWFNNMEKMKQRIRATAKCAGQYHCTTAGVTNDETSNSNTSASIRRIPTKTASPWHEGSTTSKIRDRVVSHSPNRVSFEERTPDTGDGATTYEDSDLPQDWSASETANPTRDGTDPSEVETPSDTNTATPVPAAGGGAGCSAAELAQRRWGARRALMMARRQPAAQRQPPAPPAPPPPLASVRPQIRPPAERGARRGWGRAAAPGRLSYRGPQPAKRTATDFRTGLQKLREELAAGAAAGSAAQRKRVRFSTGPPQEDSVDCAEMDDFL